MITNKMIVGTEAGLYLFDGEDHRKLLDGSIGALTLKGESTWAVVNDKLVLNATPGGSWSEIGGLPAGVAGTATCLLATKAGLLLGTAGAHLYVLAGDQWERVESFESVEGRDKWYTPWGGPPDTRSLCEDGQGNLYVNVHVGGIVMSSDGGRTWHPTIDIDADVHQVVALPPADGSSGTGLPAQLLAATSRGLGISDDSGTTWRYHTGGMDGAYCRAVAVASQTTLVTASTGPGGRRAGLYRCAVIHTTDGAGRNDRPFRRCRIGLPEWFASNIDTYCLGALGARVAFGMNTGAVFASGDSGETWQALADDLAAVRCILVV